VREARGGWPDAVGLVLGVALDAVFADPARGHPVALFGACALRLERAVYAPDRARGVLLLAGCLLPVTAIGVTASRLTRRQPLARLALTAAASWAVLGGTSLRREADVIDASLQRGDLDAARGRLPSLVGRDPSGLDASEIARAVVESVAENTSDAVVAPLLWGAVAGVPGLLGYRAVNTLDAMVGRRNQRYREFGWAAARADDLANWLPARLTGALTVALAPLVGGSAGAAWRVLRRDGGRHPSPNAGRPEAAAAGALGLRLGGVNHYGERREHRPELGDGRPAEPGDIARASRLAGLVGLGGALCCVALRLSWSRTGARRRSR
jgi:adenosylcobinamide-phosphate synthase